MNTAFWLYFGGLLVLGAGGAILIVVLWSRAQGATRAPGRPRREPDESPPSYQGPRVQVILPGVGQRLIWVVDGHRYSHPSEVTAPESIAALTDFLRQVPQGAAPVPPSASPLETPASPAEPQPAPPDEPAPTTRAVEPSLAPSEPVARTYADDLERPLLERLRDSFLTRPPAPSSPTRTPRTERAERTAIPNFDELDELLHTRLALLPDAPAASIRRGHDGLLVLLVEGQRYEHIDDVPHEGVREAMREAVRLWESRIA